MITNILSISSHKDEGVLHLVFFLYFPCFSCCCFVLFCFPWISVFPMILMFCTDFSQMLYVDQQVPTLMNTDENFKCAVSVQSLRYALNGPLVISQVHTAFCQLFLNSFDCQESSFCTTGDAFSNNKLLVHNLHHGLWSSWMEATVSLFSLSNLFVLLLLLCTYVINPECLNQKLKHSIWIEVFICKNR